MAAGSPGAEPHLLIAIARMLVDEKLIRVSGTESAGILDALSQANLPDLIRATGIGERRLRRIAHELGESEAPLVIGGASIVQSNSLEALIAAHHLNLLLNNLGKPGGMLPPVTNSESVSPTSNVAEKIKHAKVLLLDGENPVYGYPAAAGIIGSLADIEMIVSFGGFVDDSTAFADFILPAHSIFESDEAVIPVVAGTPTAFNVTVPFVRPLYDTRPIQQTMGDIARKINMPFEVVASKSLIKPFLKEGETWEEIEREGGFWQEANLSKVNLKPLKQELIWSSAEFVGPPDQFPLRFQPYVSLQYHDGAGANLPWMQELPDPVSSCMWSLPVEIDPQTAQGSMSPTAIG